MPEKIFQSNRRTANRSHSAAHGAHTIGQLMRSAAVRPAATWRDASGKAPASLFPGMGAGFSNGDRRG